MSNAPLERLQKGLAARQPLVYVLCHEEDRLAAMLAQLSATHYGDDRDLVCWSTTLGFHTQDGKPVDSSPVTDPLEALRHIIASPRDGFYLFKDFPALLADDPRLVRGLRDVFEAGARRDLFVYLSYPLLRVPEALSDQIFLVELGLPREEEIVDLLRTEAATHGHREVLNEDWLAHAAGAMKGLTLGAIRRLLARLSAEGKLELKTALDEIHEEKAAALMKEGCLEFIPRDFELDEVGGLDALKDWVVSRKVFFTRVGLESGVPLPSGVLLMGVSGCGKSMAAKVVASAWDLPLVRLDMNLVLSGAYGTPEYAFDHALRVLEQIAPLVVWIDEMENSFGYDEQGRGNNQNIFSAFLTWMQEKPPTVFVAATANRIEKLPAEVMRKGRFDQMFFLDLPNDEERRAILSIHIRKHGGDPEKFNLNLLVAATPGWSGAEIEQAVKASLVRAWQENRPFTEKDILWNTARMVPLSRTMEEQIKHLRQWSRDRATWATTRPAGH